MKPHPPLRSGALAMLVGVSPDTLRLYERKRLLRPPLRTANGYRCYSAESVARVRLIRAALSIGFTLDELAGILKIRDTGGAPCHKVRNLAALKLAGLERHIEQLVALREQLKIVLKSWDHLLAQTSQPKRAGLLEALAAQPVKARTLSPHLHAAIARETQR